MFCQRGSNNSDNFLVREEDPNTTKSGPPSARKQSAVDDDPTLNAGLVVL